MSQKSKTNLKRTPAEREEERHGQVTIPYVKGTSEALQKNLQQVQSSHQSAPSLQTNRPRGMQFCQWFQRLNDVSSPSSHWG